MVGKCDLYQDRDSYSNVEGKPDVILESVSIEEVADFGMARKVKVKFVCLNRASFEEIELQISEFSQPKDPPIRGQWMKKDEYDLILKEFYENQQRDTIIYAVPIELNTCGYWDDLDQYANQKGIEEGRNYFLALRWIYKMSLKG